MGAKAENGTTAGALRVMIAGHGISLVALAAVLFLTGSVVWNGPQALWGLGCGVIAGLSLAAFYVSLARGTMGASAAISGLLAAAIPAAVGIVLEGRPGTLRFAGFALAAAAIWLIAAPSPEQDAAPASRSVMALAIAGGIGFGLYFAGLKFANRLGVLEPLALARTGSLLTSVALLLAVGRPVQSAPATRRHAWLTRAGWFWAVGVAILDTGGNLLYIAATRAGRLDVAAVLASLYPASTILLAAAVLKERPNRRQLFGMGVAMAAVVMVTV